MIALKPFSRKIGRSMAKIVEGKPVPKVVMDSYTKDEIQELRDKKIIGDSPEKKTVKQDYKK